MSRPCLYRYRKFRPLNCVLTLFMLWIVITPPGVQAHEAWIQPIDFRIQKGEFVRAHIRVGKLFRGNSQVYNTDKIVQLQIAQGENRDSIKGRLGDIPAIRYKVQENGLHVLAYQSTGSRISYETWEKFEKFAKKEGVEWILEEHRERGFPDSGFEESFFRYAKSLFVVDNSDGSDTALGLPFEIVALTNPYINAPEFIEIQLLLAGKPYPDAQISVFRRAGNDVTLRQNIRTNEQGKASVPTEAGYRFLLNAVHMEPQAVKKNASVWHSHWASLTYEIFAQ